MSYIGVIDQGHFVTALGLSAYYASPVNDLGVGLELECCLSTADFYSDQKIWATLAASLGVDLGFHDEGADLGLFGKKLALTTRAQITALLGYKF